MNDSPGVEEWSENENVLELIQIYERFVKAIWLSNFLSSYLIVY